MFDFIDPWLGNTWLLVLLLIVGFVALVKGADWLIDGSSALAKRFHISDFVIGLTVVAFGTSMPEFVVNIISSFSGNSELAMTNILGSNSINIFVILGLTALVYPVTSKPEARKVDIPFAFIGALLVLLLGCYTMPEHLSWRLWSGFDINTDANDYISRIGGCVLLVLFIVYVITLAKRSKDQNEGSEIKEMKIWLALILIVVGLAGLTIGGELIVKSATRMAQNFHVSDAVIGLTIVALGTSLPELATSVIAAMKKNSDLALGNCIGSCIFNIFFVLSISSIIKPLQCYEGLWIDAVMAFAGPALVWVFVSGKKHIINRPAGAVLLLIYAAYLTYRLVTL